MGKDRLLEDSLARRGNTGSFLHDGRTMLQQEKTYKTAKLNKYKTSLTKVLLRVPGL